MKCNLLNARCFKHLFNALGTKWTVCGNQDIIRTTEFGQILLLQINMHLNLFSGIKREYKKRDFK